MFKKPSLIAAAITAIGAIFKRTPKGQQAKFAAHKSETFQPNLFIPPAPKPEARFSRNTWNKRKMEKVRRSNRTNSTRRKQLRYT